MENPEQQVSQGVLDLRELSSRFRPGLTKVAGAYLAEAATVCLASNSHFSGVVLDVYGGIEKKYELQYINADDQMKKTHGDDEVATESGACAIAILILEATSGIVVDARSRKGTGFDYWLRVDNSPSDGYFQDRVRLEVSGIRKGDIRAIEYRAYRKVEQVTKSNGELSAFVVVVEFGTPLAKVVKL
ncbi:MAG: hypothetical protein NUW37_08470 [Planctomycetes bacterium]|nr:hypothetical protein [Planctomycetota bacterium]